jgi:hypothetical protein
MKVFALSLLVACAPPEPEGPPPWAFPDPLSGPAMRGPGGALVDQPADVLWTNCAFLDGGEGDVNHHNLVVPYRGHALVPWAPEFGGTSGLTLYALNDPCQPEAIGSAKDPGLRESHAIGLAMLPDDDPNAGDWAVTDWLGGIGKGGIMFWDLSDATAPVVVSTLETPDFLYPDAYARVTLSVAWQYPWVYVGGADNGVIVVDATDPRAPVVVNQVRLDNGLRVGGVFAMGDRLLVTGAEVAATAVLDISDPASPQPIPGGAFEVQNAEGQSIDYYFANLAGDHALFAPKEGGGGAILYDIADSANPVHRAEYILPDANGGYVFWDEGYVFTGGSTRADILDFRDLDNPSLVGTGYLTGDLDTITPWGNVALLSVDAEAIDGQGTAVMPWRSEPDLDGPTVLAVVPRNGAENVALTTRVGLGMSEMVDPGSAFEGSVRLYALADDGTESPVRGWVNAQENTVTYSPKAPLAPNTRYRVEVTRGGLVDVSFNPVVETWSSTFRTAP